MFRVATIGEVEIAVSCCAICPYSVFGITNEGFGHSFRCGKTDKILLTVLLYSDIPKECPLPNKTEHVKHSLDE